MLIPLKDFRFFKHYQERQQLKEKNDIAIGWFILLVIILSLVLITSVH